MDNSWQSKCSSSWSSLPSSSQLPPQGSRNQMAMNAGHYFHPHVAQELRSMDSGVIQDPLVYNTLDMGSCRSGTPELGNSFLALLSGPSPHLQCDIQQLSSSKPSMDSDSTKLPMHDNSIMVGGNGCGVPLAPVGLLSQRQGNENMGSGVELVPLISSRTTSTSACSLVSDLHPILQTGNLNRYNSDITKPAIHHRVQGNQTGIDLSSQWGWLASMNFPSIGQHNATNVQASMKVPSSRKSFISDHSSAFASGRPRVFCLATRGDLLLSHTGLLGVVCICHGSHMSITKFCEHSGFCAVNPGDAVRLESGETVAQWRRLYFLKFGIRVPDDNSGWDWPEGITAAGGLVKCKAAVPNMSKNSDMVRRIDPFVGSARSGPWNGFVSPNDSHAGQSVLEKSFNRVMHTPQQRNSQEGCDVLLKSLVGTTHTILPTHADIQKSQVVKESPMPGGLALPTSPLEKGRQDSGYQSISDYIDILTKGGNSFISNQGLGNLKFLGTDSDVSRCNNSREAFIMDRDAISSNIELRLGQPSQQSHTLGASVMSSMRTQPFDTLGDCQKSLFQDHLIHNVNPRVAEESRQNLRYAPSNPSSNSKRENESQSNHTHHPPGNCSALDPYKTEQFRGDMAKSSLVSTFLSHYSTSSERDLHFRASNNMVNHSEPFMSRVLHGDSHITKCDPADFRRNRSDGTERQLNFNGLGFLNHLDKGKGALHITDNCSYMTAKTNKFHNKQMTDSSSFTGVVGGNHLPSALTVHEKQSSYLCQSAGIIQNESHASNQSNQFTKVACLGKSSHPDHAFLRSTNSSSVIAGAGLPLSTMPMGLSSTNSIGRENLTAAFSNKVGVDVSPHFMDENLRLLALRRVLDLSKQGHAIASLETKPEQGRMFSPSAIEMQRRGSSSDPLASEEAKEGPYLTIKQDASKGAAKPLQSCSNYYPDGGVEKLADVAGASNWCNFSTSSRGILICSKELDVQNSHCDSITDKQPLLRLGRIEKDTTGSGEHEIRSQKESNAYFPVKCSCAVHSICLMGNCVPSGKSPADACKGHVGRMNGNASVASIFDKGHMIPEDKAISVGQCQNLKRQIPMRNDCHASQWRDVPSKRMGVCNATCIERPAKVFDTRGNVEDQLVDTASKGFNGTQEAESLNEQQMSNICSGCSAPAVTEVSIEVNNMDSCTVNAGDAGYVNDLVVDEGSGIQKCWSSDDALDSVSTETVNVSDRLESRKVGSASGLSNLSSQGLIDDLRFGNSFILKKVQNRVPAGCAAVHESMDHTQQYERHLKTGKRKRAVKWKRLDASFPPSGLSSVHYDSPKSTGHTELHSHSSKGIQVPSRPNHGRPLTCIYSNGPSSLKRKRSALYSAKTLSWKRDSRGQQDSHQDSEDDCRTLLVDVMNFPRIPKLVGEEKLKQVWTADTSREFQSQEMNQVDARKAAKHHSLGCIKSFSSHQVDAIYKKTRPVVCGNSGIIYNGKLTEGPTKPAKIVSLRTIYKNTRRCTVSENEEPASTSMLETKKTCFRRSNECNGKLFILKKERESEAYNTVLQNEDDPATSTFETQKACFGGNDVCMPELSMLKKDGDDGGHETLKQSILHRSSSARLKSRFKEARKRSLYELAGKGKNPSSAKLRLPKISKCSLRTKLRSHGKSCLKNVGSQCHTGELCQVNAKSIKERKCQASSLDSDAFCCVCGSSNQDEINCLLECSCCLIRVHQACYGVSKVPRVSWCCRPCRTNSKNTVCVLCGYKGGAMTRALRSRNIVKSLMKAWNIAAESKSTNSIPLSKDLRAELSELDASRCGHDVDQVPFMGSITEQSPTAVMKMDLHNETSVIKNSYDLPSKFPVHNTITEGALDPTITQWVHMVCGLWTPGTRCPNVDTMSAFDVSGASRPPKNVVCSMCNRPGGSCIQCRVVNCSVHFHLWCAHLKGLLQSEVEGVDNDKVGFYGRCMLHATPHGCDSNCHPIGTIFKSPGNGEFTCARTEGYKGRKKDGFRHNLHGQSNENGGCLVPQEQINAWLHINGQKSSARGFLKPLASDIEYDCRKEYARYKQAKGWKHLVVYKSGIHALGLYTSRFISRGAMVVEYVGEIVGLRVADKREIEYQSGRKLQYKSACYFFRIDKEHIIDATRKGGIARFVNHSCLPNCVAKVISVRNEKKVVFFAERDINPGEEITYDYHFNHEDEGKKIPCFCNSKNCRRYLN